MPPAGTKSVESVAPKASADPVEGAKDLVNRMNKVQKPGELADLMTNESAAATGLMFTLVVGMAVAMSSLDPKADKTIAKDFEAMMKRYELSESGPASAARQLPPKLVQNGRRFMVDVAGFIERLDKTAPSGNGKTGLNINKKMKDISTLKFEKVSDTRVKILEPGKTEVEAEAVLEDGQWRLSLPTIMKELQKGLSSGGTAAPAPGH